MSIKKCVFEASKLNTMSRRQTNPPQLNHLLHSLDSSARRRIWLAKIEIQFSLLFFLVIIGQRLAFWFRRRTPNSESARAERAVRCDSFIGARAWPSHGRARAGPGAASVPGRGRGAAGRWQKDTSPAPLTPWGALQSLKNQSFDAIVSGFGQRHGQNVQ